MNKILIADLDFPEDPRWHDDCLWFSDMGTKTVLRTDMQGNLENIVYIEGTPSGLGWLPDGSMLIVSMADRRLMKLDNFSLHEAADLSKLASFRCNDMVVDSQGRAYIGSFGFDFEHLKPFVPGEIILVPPRGKPRIVADNLAFPNGMAITPDERVLIVSETLGECLTAFDIQEDGSLVRKRTWAHLEGFTPDGIVMDAQGAIWVASPVSGGVFRVMEGGDILQKINVKTQAYSCALGGLDLKTLLITTSDPLPALFKIKGLPTDALVFSTEKAGKIEAVEVDIPGTGYPEKKSRKP